MPIPTEKWLRGLGKTLMLYLALSVAVMSLRHALNYGHATRMMLWDVPSR